jgi:DNA polymerase elongation subunit (family B)
MKDFRDRYKDVSGFQIYGMEKALYTFLNDHHPKDIIYDRSKLCITTTDIEVDSDTHFASVENPDQEVISISFKVEHKGKTKRYMFSLYPWETCPEDVENIVCSDEEDLLERFLDLWQKTDVDIATGWFCDLFDFPYLYYRMCRILGPDKAKKLSPWGMVSESERTDKKGRTNKAVAFQGIEIVDYMRLFEKFTYTSQESYALNHILKVLGLPPKTDYEGTLADLYSSDKNKFYEYNLRDTEAVSDIDAKEKLLDLALTVAYSARIPIQDVFGSVSLWDQIIHWEMLNRNIVVSPMKRSVKSEQYAGAYVKIPKPGKYRWIVSVDYASLYPSLIIWGNFSPETALGRLDEDYDIDDILARKLSERVQTFLKDHNQALAANMTVWDRTTLGIFPEICLAKLADRKTYKKKAIAAKTEKERLKKLGELSAGKEKELDFEIARCDNMQKALKIMINSLYGAIGNAFFRYYSTDFAEAITLSGQLAVQWIEVRINEYLNKLFKTSNISYVVYGDTDSAYITLEPIVKQVFGENTQNTSKIIDFMDKIVEDHIQPFINESLQELGSMMNAMNYEALDMKREALADVGIWTAKKNYALSVYDNEGVRYAKPDLKVMGLAAVKSSTPEFCRDKLKDAIKIMLYDSQDDLYKFIDEVRNEFVDLKFEQIASPTGVNGLDKYKDRKDIYIKGTPGHVKAALIFNHMVKERGVNNKIQYIRDGDKIKVINLKTPNPFFCETIAFPLKVPKEFQDIEKYFDVDAAFEKGFISPLQKLTDAIEWKVEKKSSLEDFF